MTIYVVMMHAPGAQSVPMSAWDTMTEATLDMIERENAAVGAVPQVFTVVPVTLGRDK